MKQCLNCQKEFKFKRDSAKFCSNKCRAAYNRAHPEKGVTKLQMQSLYNEMLELAKKMQDAGSLRPITPIPSQQAVLIHNSTYPNQHTQLAILSFNELRELISAATSSSELHKAWKEVEKNNELANWQIKILNQLKEVQRTKIDF